MGRVVVITGGSSGIGRAAAGMFAARGDVVYELSRGGQGAPGVRHLTADVTDQAQVDAAMAQVGVEQGRIDLLVNNAGMGISGAIEFTPEEHARKIIDVNFFGTFHCCKAALPYLRKSGNPRIVNTSSVAAPVAIPFQAFYSASKAAVNSLTLALANEVRPQGIKVCAVMPGDARTGFTAARQKSTAGQEIYGAQIERAVGAMEKDELGGMPPEVVAAVLLKAADARSPRPLYTAGTKYKFFVLLAKFLPARALNWLVGKVY